MTYTPPGQELTRLYGDRGNMPIIAGWYQSSLGFFDYLVDHGLPETNPVAPVATREPAERAPWVASWWFSSGWQLAGSFGGAPPGAHCGPGEPLSVPATPPRGGTQGPSRTSSPARR